MVLQIIIIIMIIIIIIAQNVTVAEYYKPKRLINLFKANSPIPHVSNALFS